MKKILYLLVAGILLAHFSSGQSLLIDRGIRVEGLWCFPLYQDTLNYVYLPSSARLAVNEDSLPNFSFIRYVQERAVAEASSSSITKAEGGGILHFLVLYDTPEDQIKSAERKLQKQLNNEAVRIRGPVVFDKGRYALISSILNPAGGSPEKKILATGEAPVLENSKIALSFELEPEESKLLLESFKMANPDLSLVFDLSFSGLSDSHNALLEVDWSEVQNSQHFGAGGSIYFVSAEVELGLDELMKNNAIKLTTVGSHQPMESLLNHVYDKLVSVLFDPVEPDAIPEAARGGLMDAITSLIGSSGSLSSGNTTGFGAHMAYRLKHMKTEGKSELVFKGRSTVFRHHYITFNIGDLHARHGHNQSLFRDVDLSDPAFQQRDVYVGIDGSLEKEFHQMLNSVTVTIRKQHENGELTLKNIVLNKEVLKDFDGLLSFSYLNRADHDRINWLSYEYQSTWQFQGGGSYATDWVRQDAAMINLFTPFQRKNISLEGNLEKLAEEGIRAVSVQISYPFFDQVKQHRLTLRPELASEEKSFQITLPNQQEEVDYTVTWFRRQQEPLTSLGKDKYGVIFIDELPESNE
ncbi:hypothetical protein D770_05465 [Flammeovirgaceae bacterium 311]|nr:hypothetical protein D770_05465 [Flammeovirgaceae bacterium 311]